MTTDNGYTPIEEMLTRERLAKVLAISERHLDVLRHEDPSFPQPIMLGRLPRWSPAVIRQWTKGSAARAATEDEARITPNPAMARRGKKQPRVY